MGMDFYLGANTPSGFYSYFEEFTAKAERLYIIKGGPGSGKSTMMKRIAAQAEKSGATVSRIRCSSDPASLDGVWIPEISTMYVDGTAPHTLDARLPGARDMIIDIGQAFDQERLSEIRDEIEAMNAAISAYYREACSFLRAAGDTRTALYGRLREGADELRLLRRRRRIIASHIRDKKNNRRGQRTEVFTSALSSGGITELNSFKGWDLTELYDPFGIGGDIAESITEAAVSAGYDVFAAHDPLDPEGSPLQVIVPELHYVLLRNGTIFGGKPTGQRRIKLDRLISQGSYEKLDREELRVFNSLIRAAHTRLSRAKELHDELEALYHPFVDYKAVDALTNVQLARPERRLSQA